MNARNSGGWLESAAEALAEKFHVSPRLMRDLNPRKQFVACTEIIEPDVASSKPVGKAAPILVYKSDRRLQALDGVGRVVAQFPISLGGPRDPLPVGKLIANEVKDPALKRGERLGYVGSTGNASSVARHLHFAIFRLGPDKSWWKGTAINPYPFLNERFGNCIGYGDDRSIASVR